MSTIKKCTPTAGRIGCRPNSGQMWCLRGKHADGSRVHKHFRLEAEAINFRHQLAAERAGGAQAPGRRSRETFETYAERWRDSQVHREPDAVRYALRRAYKLAGKVPVARFDGLRLQRVQKELLSAYARSTAELTMVYVVAVLRQAHADGVCPVDPTQRLSRPRRDPHDTDGVVTPDQVPTRTEALAILAGTPPRYRLGMALGFGCGLRVGEILGLRPSDVNLFAGELSVAQQSQRRGYVAPKTWRGVRTIEVPELVAVELRRALRDSPPMDLPILIGPRGGAMRRDGFYAQAWRPALKAAGLGTDRYRFHSTRHYAVSAMLADRVSLPEVAAYVGDHVETINRVYAHFLRDAPRTAKGALDRALGPDPSASAADTES
jgi:integrase